MNQPRIFCWPDRPDRNLLLRALVFAAGWTFADHRDDADLCVLHRDATWILPGEADPWEAESASWINGRCRDVSKRRVGEVFAEVFGYPVSVDPQRWPGPMMVKSDRNYTKDGRIVTGPLQGASASAVCQRFIDTRGPDGRFRDYRVMVVGRQLPAAYWNFWRWGGQVVGEWIDRTCIPAEVAEMLDEREQAQVLAFCAAFGIDYGALDIMRDNEDGRIYIVDANSTPGSRIRLVPELRDAMFPPLVAAFHAEFGWSPAG